MFATDVQPPPRSRPAGLPAAAGPQPGLHWRVRKPARLRASRFHCPCADLLMLCRSTAAAAAVAPATRARARAIRAAWRQPPSRCAELLVQHHDVCAYPAAHGPLFCRFPGLRHVQQNREWVHRYHFRLSRPDAGVCALMSGCVADLDGVRSFRASARPPICTALRPTS